MAAWYAKQMGLPVSSILCCCNDNNGPWKLLHKGEIRTDATPVPTDTPNCDYVVPADLERLIFANLGVKYALEFQEVCERRGNFYLDPEQLKKLRDCIYVPVTGQRRLESAVKSLYHSCGYPADAYTALCYSGVFDYRSMTGEGRQVLIISEESPSYTLPFLAKCLGITPAELKKRINN
jgi:threonine synthase